MIFTGMTMLGYFSYKNLPVELFPNAELPMMFVQVMSPLEVDPKYMENQAIIPLEGAISTLEGIEELKSYSNPFNGSITISYNQKTNIKYAYLKLLEKIETVKPSLPEGFRVEVIKISMDQINNMLMNLQVRGGGGVDRVRKIVDQEIKAELESIDGIAKVEVFGGQQKSVEIILNEKKCKAVGITASQVRNIITKNQKSRTFVGKVIENNKRFFVNVSADYVAISDIEDIVVLQNGPIKLRDISEIHFGVKEQESLSRVNGKDAVTIMLTRDSQINMIELSHKTLDIIDKLNKELSSKDIEIIVENNMAETMEDKNGIDGGAGYFPDGVAGFAERDGNDVQGLGGF